MAKFLITDALPSLSGVKHLGNLARSLLSANIHARNRRQTDHEVLFLCGTDESGIPHGPSSRATRSHCTHHWDGAQSRATFRDARCSLSFLCELTKKSLIPQCQQDRVDAVKVQPPTEYKS